MMDAMSTRSGYSCFSCFSSASIVSKGRSLISSMFSQPAAAAAAQGGCGRVREGDRPGETGLLAVSAWVAAAQRGCGLVCGWVCVWVRITQAVWASAWRNFFYGYEATGQAPEGSALEARRCVLAMWRTAGRALLNNNKRR